MTNSDSPPLGELLKAALKRHGHTHTQACAEIGCGLDTFRNWVHERAHPCWAKVFAVLAYIDSGGAADAIEEHEDSLGV